MVRLPDTYESIKVGRERVTRHARDLFGCATARLRVLIGGLDNVDLCGHCAWGASCSTGKL